MHGTVLYSSSQGISLREPWLHKWEQSMPSFRKLACLVVNPPPAEDRFSQGSPFSAEQYVWLIYYSFTQISALCEVRTSQASLTRHTAEQPVAFVSKAVMEPGTHFNYAILQPREAASSVDACLQLNNFALCSYRSFTFPGGHVTMWQVPSSTTASMWIPVTEGQWNCTQSIALKGFQSPFRCYLLPLPLDRLLAFKTSRFIRQVLTEQRLDA